MKLKFGFLSSLIVLTMALSSCRFGCDIEKVVTGKLAGLVASGLNCQNVTQIQSDIDAIVSKAGLCNEDLKSGTVAQIICPIVATTAVSLLGSQVPASWQCDTLAAQQTLSTTIATYCFKLPF